MNFDDLEEVEWYEVPSFPGYSVSSSGLVRNDDTGRILSQVTNQRGMPYVGLCRHGKQYKRAIALMVAEVFLPRPLNKYHRETFDTPINLNGDRLDNNVSNLMWRPRWFAFKFHDQFSVPQSWWKVRDIEEVKTERIFYGTYPIAIEFGLIGYEVSENAANFTQTGSRNYWVWPTGQFFRYLS